jgi:hypothetical protein
MRELTDEVVKTRPADSSAAIATWYVKTESEPTTKMTPMIRNNMYTKHHHE